MNEMGIVGMITDAIDEIRAWNERRREEDNERKEREIEEMPNSIRYLELKAKEEAARQKLEELRKNDKPKTMKMAKNVYKDPFEVDWV